MSKAIVMNGSHLFDPDTGMFLGVLDAKGREVLSMPYVLFQSAVPFIMLGGDGAAAGMRWSAATDGTFTVTAEPLSGLFTGLTNLMSLFYLPASAGGASNAAGWYWGKITGATTGIIYGNTYASGDPGQQIPASPSAFVSVANGWITQVATEITGLSGITLPGGTLGPNGRLELVQRYHGDASSTKTYRNKLGGSLWASSSASPNDERMFSMQNAGVTNRQVASRPSTGVGNSSTTISAPSVEFNTLATAGDLALTETLQFSAANGNYAMIRAASRYVIYPGL